jgi:hypothetical protein
MDAKQAAAQFPTVVTMGYDARYTADTVGYDECLDLWHSLGACDQDDILARFTEMAPAMYLWEAIALWNFIVVMMQHGRL